MIPVAMVLSGGYSTETWGIHADAIQGILTRFDVDELTAVRGVVGGGSHRRGWDSLRSRRLVVVSCPRERLTEMRHHLSTIAGSVLQEKE